MHSSLIGKIEKAKRYAEEPDRVTLYNFNADFRGEHDTYAVSFFSGKWKCNCNFFTQWGQCSHTMALERLLGDMLSKEPVNTSAVD
jgi:hypothetical protein